MRRSYIRQREEWPEFRWDWEALHKPLATVRQRQGTLLARMQSIGFTLRENATLEALT